MPPSDSPTTPFPTSGASSSVGTVLAPLTASMPRSMSELIKDVDPGKLPPRTRQISLHVGSAIEEGWKPVELAQMLGVAPSFLSDCIAELRTALGFINGIFPTASDDDYFELRESIARQGVIVPIVVDEHGIIDGFARARACAELARIVMLADDIPEWATIAALAREDKASARDLHGDQVDDALYLADCGADLIWLARQQLWANPPTQRRTGLSSSERRQLAVTLNAHRRHLGRGDLRLLVEVELMLDPARADGAIAQLVGASRRWVNDIRLQLERDEETFSNSQPQVDGGGTATPMTWRPVAELDCPSCSHHLSLNRAGRDFQLALTAGE